MKSRNKDENTVTADIPESVFEEALRSVEKIQAEARREQSGTKKSAKPKEPSVSPKADAEFDALISMFTQPEPVAEPLRSEAAKPAEHDADLNVLSQLLEEEYNLEREADFFKSVLVEGAPEGVKPVDDSAMREKESQIQDLMDRLAALRREFERFRQRLTKEAEAAKKFSNESLILKLLPIIDNLERAVEHADSTDSKAAMVQGVRLIQKQLMDALASAGLQRIDAKGKTFDPRFHEAFTTLETNEVAPNLVIGDYQRGYLLFDRLIRPSRVVVSVRVGGSVSESTPENGADQSVSGVAPNGSGGTTSNVTDGSAGDS